jgi:hypothetical protein
VWRKSSDKWVASTSANAFKMPIQIARLYASTDTGGEYRTVLAWDQAQPTHEVTDQLGTATVALANQRSVHQAVPRPVETGSHRS